MQGSGAIRKQPFSNSWSKCPDYRVEFCTELYKAVHRALSTIRNNRVSTFQGEVYTGRIGPIVGTLESVRIIEVSTFQGCPRGGVPLYI